LAQRFTIVEIVTSQKADFKFGTTGFTSQFTTQKMSGDFEQVFAARKKRHV
jgi:hypothetical protein